MAWIRRTTNQQDDAGNIRAGAQELADRGTLLGRMAGLMGGAEPAPAPMRGGFQDLPESQYPRSYTPQQREHLMGWPGARPGGGLAPDIQGGERDEKQTFEWRRRNAGR